jgi:hypothetical protein
MLGIRRLDATLSHLVKTTGPIVKILTVLESAHRGDGGPITLHHMFMTTLHKSHIMPLNRKVEISKIMP